MHNQRFGLLRIVLASSLTGYSKWDPNILPRCERIFLQRYNDHSRTSNILCISLPQPLWKVYRDRSRDQFSSQFRRFAFCFSTLEFRWMDVLWQQVVRQWVTQVTRSSMFISTNNRAIPRDNPPPLVSDWWLTRGVVPNFQIPKIFPPAAGFFRVSTPFLNVSAHLRSQKFSAFGRKKSFLGVSFFPEIAACTRARKREQKNLLQMP